jgi:beta-galactosidase
MTDQVSGEANNRGLETIPFQILNQSELTAPLYVWIQGIIPDSTPNEYVYVTDLQGNIADIPKSSKKLTLSMELPSADTTIRLPRLIALRVYLSFGDPLFTNTDAVGNPTSPSGWSPGDPLQGENYNKLWDFFELTWTRDDAITTALGANLTQLDFLGLALQLDNYGYKPDLKTPEHLTSGFAGNARSTIFKAIQELGEPWSKLVLPALNPAFPNVPLRIFSPYHGMELDLFPIDQLEKYIDDVWSYYTKNQLLVTVVGGEYTGLVQSDGPHQGLFVFEPPKGSGQSPVLIQNPNTNHHVGFVSGSKDMYMCQAQLDVVPPDPPLPVDAEQIARNLGTGFMRSTLGQGIVNGVNLDMLPLCNEVGQYYLHEPVNQYAAVIHKNSILEKAYAYGYDDVCEQSSVGITKNPTKLVLTVHPVSV